MNEVLVFFIIVLIAYLVSLIPGVSQMASIAVSGLLLFVIFYSLKRMYELRRV